MYELRAYQQRAVDAGLAFLNNPKSKGGGVLVEPTGSGKSLIIASIARALEGNTIVLQPTKEILEQNYNKILDFGFKDSVGIFSASLNSKEKGKITFATIGTIIKHLDDFKDSHLIIDECHLVNAKGGGQYKDMIDYLGGKVIGLTATPFRRYAFNDMKTGEPAVVAKFLHRTQPKSFNKILDVTQIGEMYQHGYLAPIEYEINEDYKHSDLQLNSTRMDFTEESIRRYNEEHSIVGVITDAIKKHKAKHTLVFTTFVEEAEQLARNLSMSGLVAESVSGTTPSKQREQILADFKAGKIDVVTNVGVLTTGFDFPELDCVVLGRPTMSLALYYQMVGRGVRTAPGKEKMILVDACGNVEKFGKVETYHISAERPGMHRLYADKQPLTGYDFVTGVDFEKRDQKGKGDLLTFGKFKGAHLSDPRMVPDWYVRFCAEKFDEGSMWSEMMKAEAEARGLSI